MVLFSPGPLDEGEKYLYHYTTPTSLPLILNSGVLRMGAYERTNDPRETKEWFPSASDVDDTFSTEEFLDLLKRLDGRMRRRAKLLCLTRDRASTNGYLSQHHRGYARARMWRDYAADHAGACLVLRRSEFEGTARATLNPVDVTIDNVRYADRPVGPFGNFNFPVPIVRELGVDAAADRAIDMWKVELFFTKSGEWMSELEVRFLAHTDGPFEELPFWGSLAGVVLGGNFDPARVGEVRHILDKAPTLDPVPLARMSWRNGDPDPLPAS